MRAYVRRHPITAFVILAYTLSWANWIPLLMGDALVVPGGSVTHFPGLMGPAIAAFVITALVEGSAGIRRLLKRLVLVSKPTLQFFAYSLSPLGFFVLALVVLQILDRPVPPVREFGLYSGLPVLPGAPIQRFR